MLCRNADVPSPRPQHELADARCRRRFPARSERGRCDSPATCCERLIAAVYLVGGAVRDLLLGGRADRARPGGRGRPAAALQPARWRAQASTTGSGPRRSGSTASPTTSPGRAARRTREPGALPEVSPAPLAEDLQRRDFTVNAIALALGGPTPGSSSAALPALDDLEARAAAGPARPELHRRPDAPAPAGPIREPSRVRDRAAHRALATRATRRARWQTVSGPRIGAELRLLAQRAGPGARHSGRLRGAGARAAVHPEFGLGDTPTSPGGRWHSSPPTAAATGSCWALAARGLPPASCRRCSTAWRSRPTTGTRSWPRRPAASTWRGRWRCAGAVGDRERGAGAPAELVALAGALGPRARRGSGSTTLRHVRLEIDGSRPARAPAYARGAGDRSGAARGARRQARSGGPPAASRSWPRPSGRAATRVACGPMPVTPTPCAGRAGPATTRSTT